MAGFAPDASRAHIESEVDTAAWLQLKQMLLDAKSNKDMYTKVDTVIALEDAVRIFALSQGTIEAEYEAVRNS
jgi:hypothetical protein